MAFMRAGTQYSMVSRAWSTSDFFDGVADVMAKGSDSIPDLPDDIDQLEDNMGLLLAQYFVSIECFDNGYRISCLKTVLLICICQQNYSPYSSLTQELERQLQNMQQAVWESNLIWVWLLVELILLIFKKHVY